MHEGELHDVVQGFTYFSIRARHAFVAPGGVRMKLARLEQPNCDSVTAEQAASAREKLRGQIDALHNCVFRLNEGRVDVVIVSLRGADSLWTKSLCDSRQRCAGRARNAMRGASFMAINSDFSLAPFASRILARSPCLVQYVCAI